MLLPTKKSAQAPKLPKPCLLKTSCVSTQTFLVFVPLLGVVGGGDEKVVRSLHDKDGDGDDDAGKVVLGPHVDVYDDDYDCDVHGDDDDKKVVRGPH